MKAKRYQGFRLYWCFGSGGRRCGGGTFNADQCGVSTLVHAIEAQAQSHARLGCRLIGFFVLSGAYVDHHITVTDQGHHWLVAKDAFVRLALG